MQKWSQWLQQEGKEDDTSGQEIEGRLRRFWALGERIKKFLKSTLPTHAISEVIIPLEKFPNGKKYKPALHFLCDR